MSLTISANNLKNVLLKILRTQEKMMKGLNSSKNSQNESLTIQQVLEYALEEIAVLKQEIERLKSPQLMYKRPGSDKHEKITEFFDDVEIRLQKLEK